MKKSFINNFIRGSNTSGSTLEFWCVSESVSQWMRPMQLLYINEENVLVFNKFCNEYYTYLIYVDSIFLLIGPTDLNWTWISGKQWQLRVWCQQGVFSTRLGLLFKENSASFVFQYYRIALIFNIFFLYSDRQILNGSNHPLGSLCIYVCKVSSTPGSTLECWVSGQWRSVSEPMRYFKITLPSDPQS